MALVTYSLSKEHTFRAFTTLGICDVWEAGHLIELNFMLKTFPLEFKYTKSVLTDLQSKDILAFQCHNIERKSNV